VVRSLLLLLVAPLSNSKSRWPVVSPQALVLLADQVNREVGGIVHTFQKTEPAELHQVDGVRGIAS